MSPMVCHRTDAIISLRPTSHLAMDVRARSQDCDGHFRWRGVRPQRDGGPRGLAAGVPPYFFCDMSPAMVGMENCERVKTLLVAEPEKPVGGEAPKGGGFDFDGNGSTLGPFGGSQWEGPKVRVRN